MSNNAMYNCHNPFQRKNKKILCVCSAGLLRSPTAAVVLQREFDYNTRSCGIHDYALIELSDVLCEWADEIVVMQEYMKEPVQVMLGVINKPAKQIKVLNIPDNYEYMNDELQELIKTRYSEYGT